MSWRRALKSPAGIAFGPTMLIFTCTGDSQSRQAGRNLGRDGLKFAGAVNPAVLESRRRLFCAKHFPVAAKVI